MQIPVERLRQTLALLAPVVPMKHALERSEGTPFPAAQYVMLGEGRAMATNLETAAAVEMEEADPDWSGCLPPHLLGDFLGRVPGATLATLEQDKGLLHVKVDGQEATFDVPGVDDFPPFPQLEAEHEGVMDGDALVVALTALAPYTAKEETRPALTAVCLDLGDMPQAVAADGFRLVWSRLVGMPGKLPGEGQLLFPRTAIKPLAHLWKYGGKQPDFTGAKGISDLVLAKRLMRLGWKGLQLSINFGRVTMVTHLVDGAFPNYKQLVPQQFTTHVTFLAEDLYRALQGMARIAHEGSGIVRLEWADLKLTAGARGENTGDITMAVPATCEGEGHIAFDHRYLLDYARGKQGMVKMSTATPSAPAVFTYHGKANLVLMPMHVQWDTPSPYPPEPPKETAPDPGPISDPVAAYIREAKADAPFSDDDPGTAAEGTISDPPTAQVDTPSDNGHPEATSEKPKVKRARRKAAATA